MIDTCRCRRERMSPASAGGRTRERMSGLASYEAPDGVNVNATRHLGTMQLIVINSSLKLIVINWSHH